MKQAIVAALLFGVVLLAFLASPSPHAGVQAQVSTPGTPTLTVTATATPSPTATPPNAKKLLAVAERNALVAGSGHIVTSVQLTVTGKGGGKIGVNLAGDVQWRTPNKAHLTGTIAIPTGPGTLTSPIEVIVNGKRTAIRGLGSGWSCSTTSTVTKTVKTPATPSTTKTTTHLKPPTLKTVTLNGVQTWDVHQTGTITTKQKKSVEVDTVAYDIYISQTNSQIVRVTETDATKSGKNNVRIAITADLSNYGKAVTATLPKKCAGKSAVLAFSSVMARYANTLFSPTRFLQDIKAMAL